MLNALESELTNSWSEPEEKEEILENRSSTKKSKDNDKNNPHIISEEEKN